MKNDVVKKVLLIITALFLISYVIFQMYISNHSSITTEYALSYTYNNNIKTTGYIIKKEVVLQEASSGTVSYLISNGGRVAQGAVVAQVFSSDEEAQTQLKIYELEKTVADLEKLEGTGKYLSTDAARIDDRISEKLAQYLNVTDTSYLKRLGDVSDELLNVLNEKQIAVGSVSGFTEKINEIKSEITSLNSKLSGAKTDIKATDSGYFVNATDGYEGQYSVDDVADFTVDMFENAISQKPQDTKGSGKIITGYEWYFTAVLDSAQAETLSVGDSLYIGIPKVTTDEIPVKIKALNYNATGAKCAAVFECTYMNSALSSLRKEDIEIRLSSYKGLRVNTNAIRVVDGVTGVYIRSGIEAKFIPVEILYSDVGFVVCKTDSKSSSSLQLYDEVIVKGSDIYEGKIVS